MCGHGNFLICKEKFVDSKNIWIYRKIPKISPGAYIFQRPFLKGLFLEGLIFGGVYLRREICVSKSIGLAIQLEVNLPFFALLYFVFEGNFPSKSPRGGLYLEGLIHGGAYFRNFTVCGWGLKMFGLEINGHPVIREHQKLILTTRSWNMVVPWTTRIKRPAT